MTDAQRTVETVARDSYGRLVSYLCARSRDVASAEDALGDAFLAALKVWPQRGVPERPEAWLLAAARHRLIDHARHERVRAEGALTLHLAVQEAEAASATSAFPDERLKLLFVCAHPAIDPDVHTPLMLQTVLGLDAARIARAFLVPAATMGQRLVRAKTKIRDAGLAFEIPSAEELPARLNAVLEAIYAAFGSGWDDGEPRRHDLAGEALWLAGVLAHLMPEEPETHGLLALLLHCEARRSARRSADGRYVPLAQQDVTLWSAPLVEQAERTLAAAAQRARIGRFQLEAAIQSVHAARAHTGRTDWHAVALLYEGLVRVAPTLGALLGRAAAVAEASGAAVGFALLDAIEPTGVQRYQPYWAVRAHLLQRLQRVAEATAAFDRAIALTEDDAVKRFLRERRARTGAMREASL